MSIYLFKGIVSVIFWIKLYASTIPAGDAVRIAMRPADGPARPDRVEASCVKNLSSTVRWTYAGVFLCGRGWGAPSARSPKLGLTASDSKGSPLRQAQDRPFGNALVGKTGAPETSLCSLHGHFSVTTSSNESIEFIGSMRLIGVDTVQAVQIVQIDKRTSASYSHETRTRHTLMIRRRGRSNERSDRTI